MRKSYLKERGVELHSLQEAINTTSSGGARFSYVCCASRVRAQSHPRTYPSGFASCPSQRAKLVSARMPSLVQDDRIEMLFYGESHLRYAKHLVAAGCFLLLGQYIFEFNEDIVSIDVK